MIYELRIYRCMPGRKSDVLARFRDHTLDLFRKHGIELVGFWETIVGDLDDLVYITRFPSWEVLERRWEAFLADPAWHRLVETSHARGVIVEHHRTALLKAVDFLPAP